MTHYKIGFHTGPGGNRNGIGDHWRILDSAGIPASLISVDDYGPCFELDNLAKISGVPHVNVYRICTKIPGFNADVPVYDIDPYLAAQVWWDTVYENLPPEFLVGDARNRIWLIAGNEVDKNRASWLGYWAYYVATLANGAGFKIAAFGWSSGEPEYDDWTTPGMAEYLRYCADNPEEAAIAVHEYSYTMNLQDGIGYLIGRFDFINDACYSLGIRTPKIFVTEFGWTYEEVPSPEEAIRQMRPIANLYASDTAIQGAMIWYLGPGYDGIANKAQRLIVPVTQEALDYGYSPPTEPPPPPPPEPNVFDLADYFRPEPGRTHGPIYMVGNNWGQGPERMHLSVSPTGSKNHFYVSKNDRWERRYIDDNWIWLQADTSRDNNEFYTVSGDPWCPRFMKPGQRHTRSEHTTLYKLDSCQEFGSGGMYSDLLFVGLNPEISDRFGFEVVEMHWILNNAVEEKYFYAKHVGLVRWENVRGFRSEIYEFVPVSELPNKIEWVCSVLNEITPTDPTPPVDPIEELKKQVWNFTSKMQETGNGGIRLNKDAGIQRQMTKDNKNFGLDLQKVTDEVTIDTRTFMAAESLTGLCPRRVYVYEPGKPIWFFEDPN